MNYEMNKRYFDLNKPGMKWPIIVIVVGVILLLSMSGGGKLVGLLIAAAGVAWIVLSQKKYKESIVSDIQYDSEVAKNLENIEERALNKLGVDKDEVSEIEPINISGFKYQGCSRVKRGDDKFFRTDVYESVTLFFSQNEVHCYKLNYNTLEKKQTESTDVYFYQDIVSVSTASQETEVTDSITMEKETVNYESFDLRTAGGTSLSVAIRDQDQAQRSINAMRALLREKKTRN